ncbi:MAG: Dolichyl-phosphate-mannose-protein mannosyltransferase [Candidatus Amesbacteria bacterium GW2011_GWA2_47_11]|uniref:Dolichyl-phosphate-mannose-protein mannosyltransferase n=1 Tax=Candidatus Amesbacteria bacterium GW2011_GWA2_47_11 TaxID=1618357 RepID=A0A0G1UE19_9BACT|nr:MAG: Dolichyl-phosphate-mannose-protein mannosyltransferase [Candidatus Amesbacteria bacterium GW2011_GWA2_47_11]
MFILALLIGLYSYSIFFLGLAHQLFKPQLSVISILLLLFTVYISLSYRPVLLIKLFVNKLYRLNKIGTVFLFFLIAQLLINLIGSLGPELSFDALWYHLTLPKMWLSQGHLSFYPGSVFKYSAMPMLTEMLYLPALALGSEVLAKFIHYLFGILTLIVTFKLSRKYLSIHYSLLTITILSSNLVFSWLQITANIDLARTFFETLALYLFLDKKIYKSAVSLGLAASTKLLALGSLPIYWILAWRQKISFKYPIYYSLLTITILSPWLLRSYLVTGNPVYPFLSPLYTDTRISLNPTDLWTVFTRSADPVNPVYIISAPFILFFLIRQNRSRGGANLGIYTGLALFVWFITPRTGGGRFILPYLPALSVPVITRRQTKSDFLSLNLNYASGDYYDTENFLAANVPPGSLIYVAGINNLFYLNYPFLHHSVSVVPPPTSYLLLRPSQTAFSPPPGWVLVHTSPLSQTRVYAPSQP